MTLQEARNTLAEWAGAHSAEQRMVDAIEMVLGGPMSTEKEGMTPLLTESGESLLREFVRNDIALVENQPKMLFAEIDRLRAANANLRKWMNCGGAPTGKKCVEGGHEIYGPFWSKEDGSDTICEFHGFKQKVKTLTKEVNEADEEREKLISYVREIRGRRDVHSVYEVLDWFKRERDEARAERDRLKGAVGRLFLEREQVIPVMPAGMLAELREWLNEQYVRLQDQPASELIERWITALAPIEDEAPSVPEPNTQGVPTEVEQARFSDEERKFFHKGWEFGAGRYSYPADAVIEEAMLAAGLKPRSQVERETISMSSLEQIYSDIVDKHDVQKDSWVQTRRKCISAVLSASKDKRVIE